MSCRAHARDIGSAFQNREDLRAPICAALTRMCTQNSRILQVLIRRKAQKHLPHHMALRREGLGPSTFSVKQGGVFLCVCGMAMRLMLGTLSSGNWRSREHGDCKACSQC